MTASTDSPEVISNSNERLWIVLSHLSILFGVGILLPLVVYLVKKNESAPIAYHAKEALNFHISVIIYALLCIPLIFIFIGIPLAMALGIATTVFAIIAAVRGSDGVAYRYPMCLRLIP